MVSDRIATDHRVASDNCQSCDQSVRDQHAVERIAMDEWQCRNLLPDCTRQVDKLETYQTL